MNIFRKKENWAAPLMTFGTITTAAIAYAGGMLSGDIGLFMLLASMLIGALIIDWGLRCLL